MPDTLSADSSLMQADLSEDFRSPDPADPSMEPLAFGKAFKYPFNRAAGLLNIFWIFIPILGAFMLFGYSARIVRGFAAGQVEQLPESSFWSDCGLGFGLFFRMIPFFLAYIVALVVLGAIIGFLGMPDWLAAIPDFFLNIFVLPILTVNFLCKGTVASMFEFGISKAVFENLGDYAKALLKDIGLFFVYLLLCIVLVGIPAMAFTKNMFLADFYRRRVR
jgi:hypothetical protein